MDVVASSSRARVKPGSFFYYTVRLQSPNSPNRKKVGRVPLDLTDLALRVALPPGVRYLHLKKSVTPKPGPGAGRLSPELVDNVLTWPLSTLKKRSAWTIKMKFVTARNMTGPVTMSGTLFQMSGSALPPACPRAVNDVTVTTKP